MLFMITMTHDYSTCQTHLEDLPDRVRQTIADHIPKVSSAPIFHLTTSCQLLVFAARNPSSRSDNRVKPRQMTVVPGGGSLFRSKYPPRRATAVM